MFYLIFCEKYKRLMCGFNFRQRGRREISCVLNLAKGNGENFAHGMIKCEKVS